MAELKETTLRATSTPPQGIARASVLRRSFQVVSRSKLRAICHCAPQLAITAFRLMTSGKSCLPSTACRRARAMGHASQAEINELKVTKSGLVVSSMTPSRSMAFCHSLLLSHALIKVFQEISSAKSRLLRSSRATLDLERKAV